MAGQIRPSGKNSWTVRVYLGEDPATGKRIYVNETVSGSKRDAEKALTRLLRDRDTNKLAKPTALTVDSWLDRWLDLLKGTDLRPNTVAAYAYYLKKYIRPTLGAKKLEKLTPLDIQAVLSAMSARGLSARSIQYAHTVITAALNQAVQLRLLPNNPAKDVTRPKKVRKKEMRALTPAEVIRFLEAAAQEPWGIVFDFGLATGMRPSEVMGLQWKDVDLRGGAVVVQRALTRGKAGRVMAAPKTNQSRRTIPLPPSTTQSLREHKARQAAERLAAGAAYVNQDFVFAGPLGEPLADRTLAEHFKRLLVAAGLPKSIRWYDLRHTTATLLLLADEPAKVVAERLGHSTITLTLDTYSHVLPTMQKRAASKLEDMLYGTGE